MFSCNFIGSVNFFRLTKPGCRKCDKLVLRQWEMVLRIFIFLIQLCFTNFYNIEIKRYLNVSIVSTFYYLPFFLSEQSAGHQSPSHLKNLFSKVCHKTKIYFILLCVCKGIDSYAKRISHESIPLLDPLI